MIRVSQFYGMRIYNDHARQVGEVGDVVIDDKEGVVIGLVFGHRGSTALSVPYNSIMAIGDIILVYSKKPEVAQPGAQA